MVSFDTMWTDPAQDSEAVDRGRSAWQVNNNILPAS
jgi:hypothetical protein